MDKAYTNLRQERIALPLTRAEHNVVTHWINRGIPRTLLLCIKYPTLFLAALADYYGFELTNL